MELRQDLWDCIRKITKHPAGMVLPPYLYAIKALLFPVKFLRYKIDRMGIYQWHSDSYKIKGSIYSENVFNLIERYPNAVFKFEKIGDHMTITFVEHR